MTPRSWLDGAVVLERLGTSSAAGRFRAADGRGEVAWPAIAEPTEYVHLAEFASPGARRGFHRHTGHRERFYLFRGALRVLAESHGARVELEMAPGDLLTFAEGVAHGFIALEPSLAVVMGTGSNPLHDTHPVPDL